MLRQQPIGENERTGVIDVLRGFALLGVLLANLISFVSFTMPAAVIERATAGPINHYYELFMRIFIENKFVTLFSLLFGYGFGVLMDRIRLEGLHVTAFYFRRMTILFVLGFFHLFFWWGEILHVYAMCGMMMLFFRKASNRSLLMWSGLLMLVPYLIVRYFMIQLKAFDPAVSEVIYTRYLELSLAPGFRSVWNANWTIHQYIYVKCIYEWIELTQALSKFLLGYWVMRTAIMANLKNSLPIIGRTLTWCAPIAIIYMIESCWIYVWEIKIEGTGLRLLSQAFSRVGILSLSITYACLIALWYVRRPESRILGGFRFVGVMSLSNYLMHTIIYVFLLHGIGLGLMGKLSVIETLVVGLTIYFVQVVISIYWFRGYRYGPIEWLWRQLSYGRRFPIRKAEVV